MHSVGLGVELGCGYGRFGIGVRLNSSMCVWGGCMWVFFTDYSDWV